MTEHKRLSPQSAEDYFGVVSRAGSYRLVIADGDPAYYRLQFRNECGRWQAVQRSSRSDLATLRADFGALPELVEMTAGIPHDPLHCRPDFWAALDHQNQEMGKAVLPRRSGVSEDAQALTPGRPSSAFLMGQVLPALLHCIRAQALWQRLSSEAEAQCAEYRQALGVVQVELDAAQHELSSATEAVETLGPKADAVTKAQRSLVNVAAHRQQRASEAVERLQRQLRGALGRLDGAEAKAQHARDMQASWDAKFPSLRDQARPFSAQVVMSNRHPELVACLSEPCFF